jgi:protoheme IX farnesyltransferase
MIRVLSSLFRVRLALLNGVTAVGGFCLFPDSIAGANLLVPFCAVTLLAMGGSALNQLLERDIDALMARTMQRPLPQGRLTVLAALFAGTGTVLAGLALLAMTGGILPTLFGAAALVWYLAVYTPLKRKTTLALPLGALCGAFPPLIGWCLAGGSLPDYRIIILAGLLIIWQVPHFWLLQERHEADYLRVGIPLVDFRAIEPGRVSLVFLWLTAMTAAAMLLPALGGVERRMAPWFLLTALIPFMVVFFRSKRLLFPVFSLFPLALTVILMLQKII